MYFLLCTCLGPRRFALPMLMLMLIFQPQLWHLCGWVERIPGGSRENNGLETGVMGDYGSYGHSLLKCGLRAAGFGPNV